LKWLRGRKRSQAGDWRRHLVASQPNGFADVRQNATEASHPLSGNEAVPLRVRGDDKSVASSETKLAF
jgi:hypothetical protein